MSAEVAFLEIRVGTPGATSARAVLREVTDESIKAERAARKLADETERSEARKTKAVEATAAKTDKALTTAYINEGKARERMATDAAKYAAKMEAAEAKKAAAVAAAAAKADKAATDAAIRDGKAAQRKADEVAKYEAGEARKAAALAAAARRQEQTIQSAGQRQYAEVQKWLMTEEEALRASYLRRRSIIMSQGTGSQRQMDLAAMDYKYNQQLLTLRGSRLDSSKYAGTGPGMRSVSPGVQTASDAVSALASGQGIQGLTSILIRFAPAAAAAAASYAVMNKAFAESSSYKQAVLELTATTGSVENATRAYEALDAMEDKIPIGAEEMAKSFSRLVDTGLNPSERSIRALGEIATGTGNSLEKVTDAVANATMGNFKGLREFGIRAEEDGNKVKMTFRGVTTSVSNDSKSIQGYLTNLGETTFAGSIEAKMNSIEGSVFKLKDAWSDMFRDVGRNNIGPVVKEMVDVARGALEGLDSLLRTNFMQKFLESATTGARAFMIEMRTAGEIVLGVLTGDKKRIDAAIQLNDERMKGLVIERMSAQNEQDFADALKEQNLEIDKQGKIVAKRADVLAEFENPNKSKVRDKNAESQAKKDRDEFKRLQDSMRDEEDVIENSFVKRQKLIDRFAKPGEEWTRMSAASVDKFAEEMANTTAGKLKTQHASELKELQESLQDKENAERASYLKRRQFILDNVGDENKRSALLQALNENETKRRNERDTETIKKNRERMTQREALFSPYQTEIENIRAGERRKLEEYQKAREENLINEAEYQYLRAKLHKKTESDIAESDMKNKELIAGNSAALFGNLAQVSKNLGGQQSSTYKGLFAMSKAFSVAQATMSIATGTAKALELGWPAGIAAGLQVAAQGAGLLAMITSSNYSGAYDQGGIIPAGRIGLVGERGPEFVRGPAIVTGRQETAAMVRSASQDGGDRPLAIRIVNAPDPAAAHQYMTSPIGETTLVNFVRRNATTIKQILG